MTDDPALTRDTGAVEPGGESGGQPRPYLQIIDVTAGTIDAAEALERPDAYGRVPVIVRIQRQPPIRLEWVLVAIALGASGVLLPLFLALRAVIIVVAVVALIVGFMARIFMRIPPGSVGLVARASRHYAVLDAGFRRVNPALVLTHIVTTRQVAFDVPVAEVRSGDGVNVNVDMLLTLGIADPVRIVYQITTADLDQLIHATTQDAVRTLVRGIEALAALDLGAAEADRLRASIDEKLAPYGVEVRAVAFTRVVLPEALTASLEARRLAAVQLAEEEQNYALEERRLTDRANLLAQEAQARRAAVENDAMAEALRLSKLEERIGANPNAARYDLETGRLRVAQQLAGNSRAVVSLGGGDLVANLLLSQQAAAESAETAARRDDSTPAAPAPAEPAPVAEEPSTPGIGLRAAAVRRRRGRGAG